MRISPHSRHIARVLFALFCATLTTRAQVVSIFLSYHGGPNATFMEADQDITFDVVTPSHTGVQNVDYRVVSGTAEDGKDFIGSSGTLTFGPDENFKTITVHLIDDKLFEGNEQFYIELSNPVPAQPIASPRTAITIQDDDSGYATDSPTVKENDGFVEIPVHRRGDIDFASSVEVYLESETAKPGVDYVDETFTVNFGPGETLKKVRVGLINNTIEDGPRYFWVRLRNPTGGVPIGLAASEVTIEDNELGYAFRTQEGASFVTLYEGGPEPLILERRGDYDVRSVATVRVSPFGGFVEGEYRPPAAEGEDFIGTEFQVEFAPGQKSAEVPLVIVNDKVPECSKWLRLKATRKLTDGILWDYYAVIRDNEFNPLPVVPVCVNSRPDAFLLSTTMLRDGHFLATAGTDYYGIKDFDYTIQKYSEAGEMDGQFTPIVITNGRPGKIVEGSDGKYTILLTGQDEAELIRFQNDGKQDASFTPFKQQHIYDFAVASDGRIYIPAPLRRLDVDGTLDTSFSFPELSGGDGVALDVNENVYAKDAQGRWVRVGPNGVIDTSFSCALSGLRQINGAMFGDDFAGTQRLLANGQIDPSFTAIASGWVVGAPNGKFYSFGGVGSNVAESYVQRYNTDGTLDTNYMRGTFDVDYWYDVNGRTSIGASGKFALVAVMFRQVVNGVVLTCANGGTALAKIDLDVPMGRIVVEPGKDKLREKDTGEEKFLTIIRTGDNSAPATVNYRVRSGTALPGEHYNVAAQGVFQFDAGISRALVPISIIDNDKPELDRNFFVDLTTDPREPISTAQVTIVNDDVGIKILSGDSNKITILPISGESPYLDVQISSDLNNWQTLGRAANGVSFDVDTSGGAAFFSGFGYRGY